MPLYPLSALLSAANLSKTNSKLSFIIDHKWQGEGEGEWGTGVGGVEHVQYNVIVVLGIRGRHSK